MPNILDQSLFVSILICLRFCSSLCKPGRLPAVHLLSIIPVRDTPNNLSSSQFFFQSFVTYLKLVNVDCIVPSIVASLTLFNKVSSVSSGLTTTSDKLQNSLLRKIISEHGFVPKSYSVFLLSLFSAILCADALLKIPLSPDLDS